MYHVPSPVLGAEGKAVNKAASERGSQDPTPRNLSFIRETCYNQLQKLSCDYYGAGWHFGGAEVLGECVGWGRGVGASGELEKANLGNL